MEQHIMDLAMQLGAELAASEAYMAQQNADAAFEADAQAQELLQSAENLRTDLRNRLENGTPPEQLQEGLTQLRAANEALDKNQAMQDAGAARKAFNDLMNQVVTLIRYHVGGNEGSGCGGDCSSCGGC